MADNFQWDNGMIGSRMKDPFGREEYVTLTGYDSVKDQISYKTPGGTPGSIKRNGGIDVVGGGSKARKTAKVTGAGAKSITGGGEQNQQQDQQKDNTRNQNAAGVEDVTSAAGRTAAATEKLAQSDTNWTNYQKGIAVASFVVDVLNANSAYEAAKGQAGLNIMMARNQASDAIYRGRQAQFEQQSNGYSMGQDAQLAMAAQGQDVDGTGASKLSGSYEAMGYEAGAREMINAYREALGFDLEEINYNYQLENAKTARDMQIFGSALNAGVTAAVL
jgi:hypothetical protein